MDDIKQTIKQYILQEFLPGEDAANLTDSVQLVRGGILDSLATVELAIFLEEHFGIELAASDLETANLISIASIANLIEAKTAGR